MSEKYYVVSESELTAALKAAEEVGYQIAMQESPVNSELNLNDAETACRSRHADKLLAVIEAAKSVPAPWLPYCIRDALTALEEDV